MFLYSFKSVGYNYWVIKSKTGLITVLTLVSSIINIIVGISLSYLFGFYGCIIGLSIGIIVQTYMFNSKTAKLILA
jgi:O-antigen/teichoic acid export membrane protein